MLVGDIEIPMVTIASSKFVAARWDHITVQVEERGNILVSLRCECGKQIFCDTYLGTGTDTQAKVRIEFSHLERYFILVPRCTWIDALKQGIMKVSCWGFIGLARWYGSVVGEEVEVGGDWSWE